MTTGLDDLQNTSDARKTAVINDALPRLKINVAVLQETRLADYGTQKRERLLFFLARKAR